MRPACTAARSRNLLWAVAVILSLAVICPGYAAPLRTTLSPITTVSVDQYDGVLVTADGLLRLAPTAPPAPPIEGDFARYGFALSTAQSFADPTSRIAVAYAATLPTGSALHVDVRGSSDGQRWSSWETDLADGATITFPHPVRLVQYRVTLLGSATNGPTLQAIALRPVAGPAEYQALSSGAEPVAPTFRVRATRMGMVGGRTANGYIIQPRAHFVSLPSWRSLASRGGYEYQVRITYRGRSAVAPVWDVGPWNTRDDYWSVSRERFGDLPRGWPQDHAAFYDRHNGGYAEKGYVRFPTAIDVGDGVWWDALGIVGDQAEVEVTFLWLGRDPLAAAASPPDPNATEFVVDELGPAFLPNRATWYRSPTGCGEGGHAYWTLTTTDPAQSENKAFWQPNLPVEALYDVYVHVPICPNRYPITEQARYLIQHRDGAKEVVIDQARQTHWVLLGRFPFAAGDKGHVYLTDIAGDSGRAVWFDQAKWVRAP